MAKGISKQYSPETAPNIFADLMRCDRKWQMAFLAIISLVIYANTLRNGYVMDDMAVITHNTFVQKGFAGIGDILMTPSLRGFSERPVYDTGAINDIYRPVSLSMFAVEHHFFGDNPAVGHFINVLLFVCCVLILFIFIDTLFSRNKTVLAFIAAILFAVHPIHTEVVANIKSRDELLCFFFALSALVLFTRFVVIGKWHLALTGAVCFFLSLLSKETSISLVALIPIACFFYLPANRKRSILVTLTAIGITAAYLSIRFHVLNAHNANHPGLIDFMENPLTGAPNAASRYATALLVMGRYINLLFVPYPLSCDYTYASLPFTSFGDSWVWLSVVAYCTLAVTGVYRLVTRPRDPIALGLLFFLCTIAIFSNILFLTGAIIAERFLFFPSAGFCIVMAILLLRLAEKYNIGGKVWLIILPPALLWSGMTIARNGDWKDNYTLFKTDAQKYPDNARLQHSLGYELTTSQLNPTMDNAAKVELVQRGLDCYRRSLAIYPAQSKVHMDLGGLFQQIGRFDSAESHIRQAWALRPNDPAIISMLGGLYFSQGQYSKTLDLCRLTLKKAPGNANVLNNMSLCYLQMGFYDSVVYVSKKVLEMEPGNRLAADNLAAATAKQNPGNLK